MNKATSVTTFIHKNLYMSRALWCSEDKGLRLPVELIAGLTTQSAAVFPVETLALPRSHKVAGESTGLAQAQRRLICACILDTTRSGSVLVSSPPLEAPPADQDPHQHSDDVEPGVGQLGRTIWDTTGFAWDFVSNHSCNGHVGRVLPSQRLKQLKGSRE